MNSIDTLSVINLIIYTLLWIWTFRSYYKKKRTIDSGGVIILLFCLYAVCGCFLYIDEWIGETYNKYPLSLFLFVYLYIMLLVSIYPVMKFDSRKIVYLKANNYVVIDTIAVIFIIASILTLPETISKINAGITQILIDTEGGVDLYREKMETSVEISSDRSITNLPSIFINVFSGVAILILVFNLAVGRKKRLMVYLFLSMLLLPFYHLAESQRGPALELPMILCVSFFMFYHWYSEKLRKWALRTMLAFALAFLIPFLAISISRFGERDGGVTSSLINYTGQNILYFNIYSIDNNGIRYGDRCFPLFKEVLGFDNVPKSFWERRLKYPNLKINDEVFINYVGDFVLDFGLIITVFIFIGFSLWFYRCTKYRGNVYYFHNLVIIIFLIELSAQGGMKLFPFADTSGLKIIAYVLTYYATKVHYYPKRKNIEILFINRNQIKV